MDEVYLLREQSLIIQQTGIELPMKFEYCPFRQFVLSGKNRYYINHEVVQKYVPRKRRERFETNNRYE